MIVNAEEIFRASNSFMRGTPSVRPDMTLEEIISQRQDALDRAATYTDLLPVQAALLAARPVDTVGWRVALRDLTRTLDRRQAARYTAGNWNGVLGRSRVAWATLGGYWTLHDYVRGERLTVFERARLASWLAVPAVNRTAVLQGMEMLRKRGLTTR